MNNWLDPNNQGNGGMYGGQNYYSVPQPQPYGGYYIQPQPRNITGPIYYTDASSVNNNRQQTNNPPLQNYIPAFFVNSKEEALAFPMTNMPKALFMDMVNPYIYIRKYGEDGIPLPLRTIRYEDFIEEQTNPSQEIDTSGFVRKEDLENFKKEIIELLK